jgi:hypothetical protein
VRTYPFVHFLICLLLLFYSWFDRKKSKKKGSEQGNSSRIGGGSLQPMNQEVDSRAEPAGAPEKIISFHSASQEKI